MNLKNRDWSALIAAMVFMFAGTLIEDINLKTFCLVTAALHSKDF